MSPAEWETLIGRVSFAHLVPPVRVLYAGNEYGPMVVVVRPAPDRDPPHEVKEFRTAQHLPIGARFDERAGIRFLLHLVEQAMIHEVREHMTVDGVHLFDPHLAVVR